MVKAVEKRKQTERTKLKKLTLPPDHMPESRRPDIAEKHRTSRARTPRPQNSIPPIFQSPGDRRKRATTPTPRTETPATADHLHGKIPKLALFNIKLLLKKYEGSILHIPNQSNWTNIESNWSVNHHFCSVVNPYPITQIR